MKFQLTYRHRLSEFGSSILAKTGVFYPYSKILVGESYVMSPSWKKNPFSAQKVDTCAICVVLWRVGSFSLLNSPPNSSKWRLLHFSFLFLKNLNWENNVWISSELQQNNIGVLLASSVNVAGLWLEKKTCGFLSFTIHTNLTCTYNIFIILWTSSFLQGSLDISSQKKKMPPSSVDGDPLFFFLNASSNGWMFLFLSGFYKLSS